MSDYRPPLRDIQFTLEHIADLGAITALPDFEHVESDVVLAALDEAGRFMSEVVAPTNRIGDIEGSTRNPDGSVTAPAPLRAAYEKYVAAGWGAVSAPTEFGGHGFPGVVGLAVQEMLTTANMALSLCPMLSQGAIKALWLHGDDAQRATWLRKLVSGEWTGTMVLTEPEAGSDVGAVRAKAEPAGDGTWRIRGTKIFITWGEHDMADNIVHLVLARAPGAPPGTKGISMFLVPKFLVGDDGEIGERNDVHCVSVEHKLGIHASPTCVLAFGEGDGAVGYLMGEVHQGMRYMFTMMNDARLNVGLEGLAVAERSYQQALAYAQERRQGRSVGAPKTETSLIIDHPDIRRMLMTMKAHIEAMRALMYDNGAAMDRELHADDPADRERWGARAALLTPVSKAWSTDRGVDMASLGLQIFGGMGYVEETGIAQHFRDARIAPIYEGTNGIQAIDLVMRKLPMDGGRVVRSFIDEMAGAGTSLAESDSETLAAIGIRLGEQVRALSRATDHLLSVEDPNDALAGATPYLEMFGIVAGGYYLARQAAIAHERLQDGPDDYLTSKVATALFYAEQILPSAAGLAGAVTAGALQLMALEPKQLGA